MDKRRKTCNKQINLTHRGGKQCSQEVTQAASTSISSLPPEVLINIFGYLSSRERIQLEAVCKRWNFVVQKSWQTIKKFEISAPYRLSEVNKIYLCLNDKEHFAVDVKESHRVIQKLLSLCGFFVQKVELCGEIGEEAYSLIGDNCPNLIKLKLEEFEMYESVQILGPLFQKCKQLKSLKIDICDSKLLSVLKQLPIEKVENLKIQMMISNSDTADIIPFVEKLQSLRNFTFPIYGPLMKAVGMKINLNFPFSLHHNCFNQDYDGLELFDMLDVTNLEDLYIPGLSTPDDFFLKLAVKCENLKYLHIGERAPITEKALNAVSTLPNLLYLKVAGIPVVTDEILPKLNNITVIDCANCETLTGNGYISLIKSSDVLEELVISYQEGETEDFLKKAVEFVETSGKILTIGVYLGPVELVTNFGCKSDYLDIYIDDI